MSIPSIYINLEDDVSRIATRLKHQTARQVILVCPKRCFLFSDSINLKLLKKQVDILGKELFILTMDEKGQGYAQEAGFQLKFLPKINPGKAFSDVNIAAKIPERAAPKTQEEWSGVLAATVNEIKQVARKIAPAASVKREKPAVVSLPDTFPKAAPLSAEPKPETTETFFPEEIRSNYSGPKAKRRTHRLVIITALASLVLALLLIFVVLPKATVVIYPRTEPVTREMEISVSANIPGIDPAKLAIPGIKIDETLVANSKFQSQGKKQVGNRAGGTIKIYNFTKSPINLKDTTTTITLGGKNYNLAKSISGLRPTVYKDAKTKEVDEKSLGEPIEIIAALGGEEYNLPAGTRLEITNQVFGSNPQFLYAKTDSEIIGGTTRYLSIISQEDATQAQAQLEEKAVAELRQKFAAQGLILADKAFLLDGAEFALDNPVGSEAPVFQGVYKAKITGMAFKDEDLQNLILKRIRETLSTNKTLQVKNPNQTTYKAKSLDINNQLAVLEVRFEGRAVYNLDMPNLSSQLVGKSREEVREILKSKTEIDKIDVILAPSWQKNFPYFANKINVVIASDDTIK